MKLTSLLFMALVLSGCDSENKYSDDKAALLKLVKLDLPFDTVRWEVFGTPEQSFPVPGPTDFYTLVVEIAPAVPRSGTPSAQAVWIAPEAARSWLSPAYQSLFTEYRNGRVQLSSMPGCRPLETEVATSGRRLQGFLCSNAASSVAYLMLSDGSE